MTIDLPVKDVMSKKLITLHPKDKLSRAKEIFSEYDIHHIPILVKDKVVGILSMGDILFLEGVVTNSFDEFIRSKRYEESSVDEYMTANPICIDHSKTLADAIEILIEFRINAIPVVGDDMIKGIITTFDILKYIKPTK